MPSLAIQILFWGEVIVCARILFFTVPVLINHFVEDAGPMTREELFILFLTFISFLYIFIGILSILRNPAWKPLHYLGAGVTLILTGIFLFPSIQANEPVNLAYCWPLLASFIIVLLISIRK